MFAYCNNSPVSYTDPSGQSPISFISVLGQKFSKWICNLVVDECDSETTSLGEKLLRTCASFVYNLELSAGVGMGFYGETEIWDTIGLSAGMYITNISACYENGSWQLVNEAYTGISATFLWNEVGAAEYGTRPYGGGGEWENNHWVLYNDTESSITIYSASAYFFGGGSVRVGFDLNTFLHDISNIWGVGLYARK